MVHAICAWVLQVAQLRSNEAGGSAGGLGAGGGELVCAARAVGVDRVAGAAGANAYR